MRVWFLQGGSTNRDEDLESLCSGVAEKALLVYGVVLRAVGGSTRAGGHVSGERARARSVNMWLSWIYLSNLINI